MLNLSRYVQVWLLFADAFLPYFTVNGAQTCSAVVDNMCVTEGEFPSWSSANDHCLTLGGALGVPSPGVSDGVAPGVPDTQVWVGGRSHRVWSTDNSSYYHAEWDGCTLRDVTDNQASFRPSNNLSECLQSCSRFKYAYVKTSFCGCSNIFKYIKTWCDDPTEWAEEGVMGDDDHRFTILPIGSDERHCGAIQIKKTGLILKSYEWHRIYKPCDKKYRSLCQSAHRPTNDQDDYIQYGNTFLWQQKTERTWLYAKQSCHQGGGTLAKLDWQSPSLAEKLYNMVKRSNFWIALDRVRWRFVNGDLVTSTWPNFTPEKDTGCLVMKNAELVAEECSLDTPIPALCTLPEVTTVRSSSMKQESTEGLLTTDGTSFIPGDSTEFGVITDTSDPILSHHVTPTSGHVTEGLAGVTAPMDGKGHPSKGVYVGVGVTVGVLVVGAVVLAVICRIRGQSQPKKPPNEHRQTLHANCTYDANDLHAVVLADPGETPDQPDPCLGADFALTSLPDVLYAEVNRNRPEGSASPGCLATEITAFRCDDTSDQYDSLMKQRAAGAAAMNATGDHLSSPVYANVSSEDSIDTDRVEPAVTSPYDHVVTRGRTEEQDSQTYDELEIPNVRREREVDMSSVYNHVVNKVASQADL